MLVFWLFASCFDFLVLRLLYVVIGLLTFAIVSSVAFFYVIWCFTFVFVLYVLRCCLLLLCVLCCFVIDAAVLTWALQFLVFGWVRCFLCADLVLAGGLVIWWLVGIADYGLWLISCLDVWMV